MKEVLKVITDCIDHDTGILVLTDIKENAKASDSFTYYLETRGILKADKTYRVTIEEL